VTGAIAAEEGEIEEGWLALKQQRKGKARRGG